MNFECFTGGPLDTNAYYFESGAGTILFDAPQGASQAFGARKVDILFLTHGHFDHVADAAEIQRVHGCRVLAHELTVPMITDREFFHRWGFALEVEPVDNIEFIGEGDGDLLGETCKYFHVPGHCPGSLCTYFPGAETLVGGDVLFAGGVGRWDLPGGDYEALISGIQSKLLPLGDSVKVLPGHGPPTTIGRERQTNSFLIH
jgi:hydroxyacylglutathione hydrolase